MAKIVIDAKTAVGKVYFSSGDTEDIYAYVLYSDDNIVFHTKTGKYAYRYFFDPIDDCGRFMLNVPRSCFYKSRIAIGDMSFATGTPIGYDDDWFEVAIDRIELLEVK